MLWTFLLVGASQTARAQTTVDFPDPKLEAAVRAALADLLTPVDPGPTIETDELVGVGFTFLDASTASISDLTGLEAARDLTLLFLDNNKISDVSPLSGLKDLTTLFLFDNQIVDVSPLSRLANLTFLVLSFNPITDVSPLSGLINLTFLFLSDTQIVDVSPLSALRNLTDLDLSSNQLTDVSPLSGLTDLTSLFLSFNPIHDVSPLSALTSLATLFLADNQIVDVTPLSGLANLTFLVLSFNQIIDLSPLAGLINLTDLDLSFNPITDVGPLSGLTNLTTLYLFDNQIADVGPLSGLTNLTFLVLPFNLICNISALVTNAGLDNGDTVFLEGNPLSTDSIQIDIPTLQSRGVDVSFDNVLRPVDIHVILNAGPLPNGGGPVDFGSVVQGAVAPTRTFEVNNPGGDPLTISNLTAPSGYSVVEGLDATIQPCESDSFTLRLMTDAAGMFVGAVSFQTNVTGQDIFEFTVTGDVIFSGGPTPTPMPTSTPTQSSELFLDFARDGNVAAGWLAPTNSPLVTASDQPGGSAVAGLCINTSAQGDNLGVWESPRAKAIPLVANSVYRIRFQMSTDQIIGGAQPLWDILVDNFDPAAGRIIWGSERWFFANTGFSNAIGNTEFDGLTEFDAWIVPNAVTTDAWNGLVNPEDSPFDAANQAAAAFNIKFRVLDLDSAMINAEEDSGTLCLRSVRIDRFALADLAAEPQPIWGGVSSLPTGVGVVPLAFSGSNAVDSSSLIMRDDNDGVLTILLDEPKASGPEPGQEGVGRAFVRHEDMTETGLLRLFPVSWNDDELLRLSSEIRSVQSNDIKPVDVIALGWETATDELGGFDFTFRGASGGIMERAGSPRDDSANDSTYTSFFYTHHSTDVDLLVLPNANRLRGVLDFFNRTDLAGPLGEGILSDPFEIRSMAIHRIIYDEAIFGPRPAE